MLVSACDLWRWFPAMVATPPESSGLDEGSGGGPATGKSVKVAAQPSKCSDGAWVVSGSVLEDRPTGLDGFFWYEGTGVGGETQK